MADTDSRTASVGTARAASRRNKKMANMKSKKSSANSSNNQKMVVHLPPGGSFSHCGLDVNYNESEISSNHEENENTDSTSTTTHSQQEEKKEQLQQDPSKDDALANTNPNSPSALQIDDAAPLTISTPSVKWNSGLTNTIGTSSPAPKQSDPEPKISSSFANVNNAYWRAKSDEEASSSHEDPPHTENNHIHSDQEEGEVLVDNAIISSAGPEADALPSDTDAKPTTSSPLRLQSKGEEHYYAESDASFNDDDDDEPSDIILNFSGDEAQDSRLEELHNARKTPSFRSSTPDGVQVVAPLQDISSITTDSLIRREAAIRKLRAKYPIDPTTLADLTRQDLEKQAKYLFYHLNINDIDLSLPIKCIDCFEEGHLSEICPNKICHHCEAWEAHDSRFCPLIRRCQHCRGRGHNREGCTASRRSCHDVPCDLCGSALHFETECETLWRSAMRPTSVPPARIKLSISCAYCANTGHLFGDCPEYISSGAATDGLPWSLKGIDPATIINLNTVPYVGVRNGLNKIDGSAGNGRNANNRGNDYRIKGKSYSGSHGSNKRDRRDDSSLSASEESGGVFGGGSGHGRNRIRPLHQLPNRPPIRFNTDIRRGGGGGSFGGRGGFHGTHPKNYKLKRDELLTYGKQCFAHPFPHMLIDGQGIPACKITSSAMGRGYLIGLACFAATGSFLFGYDSGVMTNVIASPNYLHYFDTYPESNIIGAINSTFSGGAAIGSLCGGYFTDKIGRKLSIQLGAVVALVGAALQAGSVTLGMLLVGRIVAGWAIGIMSMAIPIYQAECAHPARRGMIIGIAQQMIGVGFIVSGWVGYACNHAPKTSTFQWRFPLALQCAPAILLAVGMPFFPESPRHLISKDKLDQGLRVLRRLHYNGVNESWINEEFMEIKNTISAEKEIQVPRWSAMFTVPQWRKRLAIATSLQMFTQSTGTNVINYYQTVMYRNLGIKGDTVSLMACFFNMVGPITNIFFITLLIDRVGRRKPLLYGCLAITTCLLLEGITNSQNIQGNRKALSALGILWIYLVSVFFSLSFGPISWTYMSEIMPYQVRGTGVAFATGIGNWAISTMWAQVSPKGLGKLGWKYYFVFVAVNICISLPCIYFFFPETKQKSLEDIDNLFGGVVDISRWQTHEERKSYAQHIEELSEDRSESMYNAAGV
ncbi:hypothetical protein KEM54_006802 [Ascosphaera aggregata]|nr:hypothetical protein KEM54_006802 [Ascosphaera aggregata]